MHFSLIKASDLVVVNEEGEVQTETPHTVSHAGFIIHSVLHQMRPDINVAVHLHSPHGVAWSAFGRPVEMLVQGNIINFLVSWFSEYNNMCSNCRQICATSITTCQSMKTLEARSSRKKRE